MTSPMSASVNRDLGNIHGECQALEEMGSLGHVEVVWQTIERVQKI